MSEEQLPNIAMLALLQWAQECATPADRAALCRMMRAAADYSPNISAKTLLLEHILRLAGGTSMADGGVP